MNVRTILELCRIPNVFTAFANVAAGVVLARGGSFELGDLRLVIASGLMYCAGMVLNDYYDREVDARERPERPIPSGRVTAAFAGRLGAGLMATGVALACSVSELSLLIAAALALEIVIYDSRAKSGKLGPLSMGACRLLNVALGLTVVTSWTWWMWVAPMAMGLYTAVITYLARDEVQGSSAVRLHIGVIMMMVLGFLFAIACTLAAPAGSIPDVLWVLPFLAYVVVRGVSLFRPLLSDPSGPTIGRAIGGGILMMPVIDATFVAAAGYPSAAALVAGFALPAILLKRAFYVT